MTYENAKKLEEIKVLMYLIRFSNDATICFAQKITKHVKKEEIRFIRKISGHFEALFYNKQQIFFHKQTLVSDRWNQ